jgi:RNA polymerase sigma-70 factor (ECF subfamily)
VSAEVIESAVDPGKSPDERVLGGEVSRALEQAIRSLEPGAREVLLLRDVEGLTAPQVASVLDLSVEAVKSRLHRARLAVRAQIAPLLGIPEATSKVAGDCPDVLSLWSQHLEGEITGEVCARMEQHLAGCARCRGACDSLKQTLAMCGALPAAPVPPAVQLAVRAAVQDFLSARALTP